MTTYSFVVGATFGRWTVVGEPYSDKARRRQRYVWPIQRAMSP